MAASTASPVEMLPQLEAARKLALNDAQVYSQVVPGILPLIGPSSAVEVRRWGADFLAECFATPSFPSAQKELLVADVLPALRGFLENPAEDVAVLRSVVQTAASLYPLVFKRVASNPDQQAPWQNMIAIKISILQRMDTFPLSVKICCIKFLQKVVQVQTAGVIADPRRPEQNETSLAIVSRQHPLLPLPQLEAEGAGLLDRLLSVFQDPNMDPILVDATLNCLAVLIRTRPPIANKILAAVLNFNPLRSAPTAMTPRLHVIYRSMERTTFALLKFVLKSMPNHSMAEKIHAYMMRLQQQRTQMFSGAAGVKRPAEPTDGLDDAKRQRLTGPEKFPPMPHPPNTVAQLFTLTEDTMLHQFDVKLLPADIVSSVVFLLMQMLEQGKMDPAIAEVRARYEKLKKASLPTAIPDIPLAGPTGIDDEDDYEPDFALPPEGTVANTTEKALEELAAPALDLGPFELPKPPPLTGTEVATLSDQSIRHVLNQIVGLESAAATTTRQKLGLNRLAAAANDRDAWVTIICRLAARTSSSIDEYQALSDSSQSDSTAVVKTDPTNSSTALANRIREHLFMYILDDFRPRLSIAISWLSEEWYADKLHARSRPNDIHAQALPNYATWSIRLLDRLVQYLDARDKNLLIRFLSEIPSVTPDIMALVKTLARDPERVGMCILAMQYLLMFRPPSRNVVMRVLREVWEEGDAQVKGVAGKALKRFEHLEGGGGQAVEGGDVRVDEKSAVKRDGEGQVAKNEEEVAKNEADEVRVQNEADV